MRTGRPTYSRVTDKDLDVIAQQLLEEFADDYPEDLDMVLSWVKEAASGGDAIMRLAKFKYPPVGPREFIESKAYMDKAGVLWPLVMDEFEEMNSGKFTESVLTGGIGVAKTTMALYSQAYQLYLLSCLRNPHEEFDLDPSSEIVVIFQSLNEKLAKDVDYARFRDMLANAPYFRRQFPFDRSRESEMRFPNRIVVKPVSGQDTGAIGQNVIGGIIDEINFMAVVENSKVNKDGATYDQAVQNYNSIARRRESRFMQKGTLPGMLCLVSSRNYPGQFTDLKEQEARTNPRIFVYDKRLWDIRPERFVGEKFRVFIGDETRKPRIMQEDEIVSVEDQPLVMAIPTEYRNSFENDMLRSLRDVAGVSTQALHPFMLNTDAVANCFGVVHSIASRDDVDFVDTKLQIFPGRIVNPDEPRFAHIDLSISKDSCGISIGHISHFEHVNRGDHVETLPVIRFDMLLEVRPPRGGEIIFDKIRRLLYVLRDDLKLPLKYVSFDQFQSKDSMQILHQAGFMVGYRSMDTDTWAYDMTKQAFYDGRILAPEHKKAQSEMVRLEIDHKKHEIDHPPNGSKDVADSMAGVIIGLTLRRELWVRHKIPLTRIPKSIADAKPERSAVKEASYMDRVRAARGVVPKESYDEAV